MCFPYLYLTFSREIDG
uniref:Uncharacterized protein n=1 Tax=Rhizophora mucronata TaxID=61149 RepID=A0A2P2LIC3_RHIMU